MTSERARTAIVTGAARGIGEATTRLLAARGWNVVVADIDSDTGERVAREIGEGALFAELDVADEQGWRRTADVAAERFGAIGVLVNNAGGAPVGSITEQPREDYERVIAVNQTGVWLGIRAIAPHMRDAGGGSIVNVSSAVGMFGVPGLAAYSAAKFAVRGITRTAALELAADGIRVNSVHPGLIDTPATEPSGAREAIQRDGAFGRLTVPLKRIGTADEVARLIAFLASDESSYCTGAEYLVDGGMLAGPPSD
jgi:3alpha(or 20beta)-hydroxysteroid dehydrogenase